MLCQFKVCPHKDKSVKRALASSDFVEYTAAVLTLPRNIDVMFSRFYYLELCYLDPDCIFAVQFSNLNWIQ